MYCPEGFTKSLFQGDLTFLLFSTFRGKPDYASQASPFIPVTPVEIQLSQQDHQITKIPDSPIHKKNMM